MTDRPILFSSAMIRSLLAGTKTQTRRLVDFPGVENVMDFVKVATDNEGRPVYEMKDAAGQFLTRPAGKGLVDYHFSPRIGVGDRLWVRESGIRTKLAGREELPGLFRHDVPDTPARGFYWVESTRTTGAAYSVEGCSRKAALAGGSKACPSIHMPRWASRLTLIVTDVRIERLQDISEADAIAEGVEVASTDPAWPGYRDYGNDAVMNPTAKGSYRTLWDHINGDGSWTANPWIVAYSFRVIKQNIDQIEREAA